MFGTPLLMRLPVLKVSQRVLAGPVSHLSPSCFILRLLLNSLWPK